MTFSTIVGNAWLGGAQVEPVRIRIERGRITSVDRGSFAGESSDSLVLKTDEVLLPGFHDAHLHLITGGVQMAQIDFGGAKSVDAVLDRISGYIARRKPPRGEWIEGHGLEQTEVTVTRTDLDRVSPNNPFFAWTHDLHSAVANSEALIRTHVDGSTKSPEGGSFERGADGKLNGILREKAAIFVADQIPDPSPAEYREAFLHAQRLALSLGITSASASVRHGLLDAYLNIADSADQIMRLNMWKVTTTFDFDADKFDKRDSGKFRYKCFKGFTDGALGSRTASFWQPYSDDVNCTGELLIREGPLARFIRSAHRDGYQIAMHAIGDRANSVVLDAIEMAGSNGIGPELRPRIEHCQHLRERDIERFAKLGVVASMQPIHCTADMNFVERRLGKERESTSYAWKSLKKTGAILAFGSDWPIESMNPLEGVHAAVTRTDRYGKPLGGWHSEQCISVEDALTAYTHGAAFAAGWDHSIGRIEVGHFADFCVLSSDPFKTNPHNLLNLQTTRTIVNGKTEFERS